MGWNYLSIPKLQRCNRWSLGMNKYFHPTLHNECNYLSILVKGAQGLNMSNSQRQPSIIWSCLTEGFQFSFGVSEKCSFLCVQEIKWYFYTCWCQYVQQFVETESMTFHVCHWCQSRHQGHTVWLWPSLAKISKITIWCFNKWMQKKTHINLILYCCSMYFQWSIHSRSLLKLG